MKNSENDDLKEVQREANTYEDEINLMDYFLVLWKRKWFIFLASVLPALVVGLVIFLGPRNYKITYLYNTGLDEKNYKILLDQFYCAENLEKIVNRLNENGLGKCAQQIDRAGRIQDLKEFINLEVSPSFFENLDKTSIEDLQKIQQAKGTLLAMTITDTPQKDMYTISSIMRDDFEKVIRRYDRSYTLFFCDPPYWQAADYGIPFKWSDHERLAKTLRSIKGKFLLTINNHPDIRRLYIGLPRTKLPVCYTVKKNGVQKTHELIIANYSLSRWL